MERASLRVALHEILEEERGESFPGMDEATSLRDELGLDSVDLVSLVLKVEERFRVALATADLEAVSTVGQLLDLLQDRLLTGARAA